MARLFDDGSNEYLSVTATPVTTSPFTFAGWFNSNDLAVVQTILTIGDVSAWNDHYELYVSNNDRCYFTATHAGGGSALTATGLLTANTWQHLVGIEYAVDSRAIFLDGGNKATNSTSKQPVNLDTTRIGRDANAGGAGYMSGLIAEAAIWNVALTDAEVAVLALGFSPLFVHPQNLIAYWPLFRDEDQDRVGGYDMTAYNTPSIASHPPMIYPAPPYIAYVSAGAPPPDVFPPVPGQIHRQRRFSYIRM